MQINHSCSQDRKFQDQDQDPCPDIQTRHTLLKIASSHRAATVSAAKNEVALGDDSAFNLNYYLSTVSSELLAKGMY